jgi:hypothetical protein
MGGIIELAGWLGVALAVLLAVAALASGDDDYSGENTAAAELLVAITAAFSSLFMAAIGRALRVLADYLFVRAAVTEVVIVPDL